MKIEFNGKTAVKIYIFLLFSLLPGTMLGQDLTGHYRAAFISPGFAEQPTAEFQVQADGMVTGQIVSGKMIVALTGQVAEDGTLKAESGRENGTIYTLEADLSPRAGKITLTWRNAESSAGGREFSRTIMQGNYEMIDSSPIAVINDPPEGLTSELLIEQPHPLFETRFVSGRAKIILEKQDLVYLIHLEMDSEFVDNQSERGFYFTIASVPESNQTIWKIENIRALNYVEKTENFTKIHRFRSNYEIWKKNSAVMGGQIELLWKTGQRMAFAIKDLKIKNEAGDDTITINGKIYAEISDQK